VNSAVNSSSSIFEMAGTLAADQAVAQVSSTTIFFSLLLPALALWYVYWKISRRHMYQLAEKLPGPKGLPFIGNALDLTGTSHSELRKKEKRAEKIENLSKDLVLPGVHDGASEELLACTQTR
jgi:cytochrome P450 family 4